MRAHAKINLLLRVLAREESGYHGVETLLQRLSLHDIVHVSVREPARTLECDGPTMPSGGLGAPEENLAWIAAERFADAVGWDTGWRISIEKRIPVGGGLGGGSADAAAVLRAMNAMSPAPLSDPALLEIAGTLGADVPFLTAELGLALAWNRGDRMLTLPALPPMGVTLVTFDAGVNTAHAYAALAIERGRSQAKVASAAFERGAFASWKSVCAGAVNDFEEVVPALHAGVSVGLPLVRAAAERLRANHHPALGMMSGSGATCFLLHPIGIAGRIDVPDARVIATTTA